MQLVSSAIEASMEPDLLSMTLDLRPLPPPESAPPAPDWWGRAAQALLLDTVRQYDEALSQRLHDPENPTRPFTASTLLGYSPRRGLDSQRTYSLRMTSISQALTALLLKAAESGPLSSGRYVELDYRPLRIESVQVETHSTQELSAPYLLAKVSPERRISLELLSPTYFKQSGKYNPIPQPDLVFGSLLDRWNAFAPIAFPAELRRYAAECLAVSFFKISSRVTPFKGSGVRIGAVGEVTYTSTNFDRYWMSLAHTLAEFAYFSGVGAGVASGMGQCRVRVGRGEAGNDDAAEHSAPGA